MSPTVELHPLNCIHCSMPVSAQVDEVAWLCRNCGAGMMLTETSELVPCEFNFSADLAAQQSGRPFWVAEGVVTLRRESYNVIGDSDHEAMAFWSQPRRFFIPAYSCNLEEMLTTGLHLLTNPPPLVKGAIAAFSPITHSTEDFRPFAEFLILALEAGRKDKVKQVHFDLELKPPVLWILP